MRGYLQSFKIHQDNLWKYRVLLVGIDKGESYDLYDIFIVSTKLGNLI